MRTRFFQSAEQSSTPVKLIEQLQKKYTTEGNFLSNHRMISARPCSRSSEMGSVTDDQTDSLDIYSSDSIRHVVQNQLAGVPMWAIWSFVLCAVLIIAVLLLDYCVIRRNALGNTCCSKARQKRGTTNAAHQKRSTNMLLNKLNRNVNQVDQDV